MEKIKFDYFRGKEAEQYSFYRIPKILFTEGYFKNLSCDAKLLYGILLDRTSLSIKNRWIDKENRVYIVFRVEEVAAMLNCGTQKAVKLLKELDSKNGIGLIEKKRLGLGKPNIIYVKNFMSDKIKAVSGRKVTFVKQNSEKQYSEMMENSIHEYTETEKQYRENQNAEIVECEIQKCHNSYTNNTEENDTECSETDIISYPIHHSKKRKMDTMERMEFYRQLIYDNISYESFLQNPEYCVADVDELVELIVEVMLMPDEEKIRIAGEEKPAAIVKNRFLQISYGHIEYVCLCLQENTRKVENIKGYLLTTLYNAVFTKNHYYHSRINYDMYGKEQD